MYVHISEVYNIPAIVRDMVLATIGGDLINCNQDALE